MLFNIDEVQKKQTGVYCIENKNTGKCYIGSTERSFWKRYLQHLCDLKNNNHDSIKLQNSWNKHGSTVFEFRVVEVCERGNCLSREQYWMDFLNVVKDGYNICPVAGNCTGRKLSKESIEKTRQKNIGRKCSDETKLKMSLARTGKPSKLTGRRLPQEVIDKIKKNNSRFWLGKKRSKEDILKMSKPKKFKNGFSPNGKSILAIIGEKVIRFNSMSEAARSNLFETPPCLSAICRCCKKQLLFHKIIDGVKVVWRYEKE